MSQAPHAPSPDGSEPAASKGNRSTERPTSRADGLWFFLDRARRVGRRRQWLGGVVLALVMLAALGLGGTLLAAATLRGDLSSLFVGIGAVASLWVASRRTTRALHAGYGPRAARPGRPHPLLTTAKTVAATERPLYPSQGDPVADPDLGRDGPFRREILAAAELELARDDGSLMGSAALANRFVRGTAARLGGLDPRRAVPSAPVRRTGLVLAAVLAVGAVALANPRIAEGARLLWSRADGRPTPPPQPVWSQLDMTIEYPAHTGRPARTVHNPSGTLRVPAGTTFAIELRATAAAESAAIVLAYDGATATETPPPQVIELDPGDERRFSGRFSVKASGSWRVVLDDGAGLSSSLRFWSGLGRGATRRSPALSLELEPDEAPQVDLRPLPEHRREVSETDAVDIRFTARDDFGLERASLVYELADGEQRRVPAGRAPAGKRRWQRRFTWDLSTIPVDDRGEVTYWIEVRDNDPGLGLVPLDDPPGKIGRSARQQLMVNDEEAEHAKNIDGLRAIRDAAVDLLAERLTTTAYDVDAHPPAVNAGLARDTFARTERLLASMATSIDALSMDTMARERDIATLSEVHGRIRDLHEKARKILEGLPPGTELETPDRVPPVLARLGKHNVKAISNLEDEIIRLDDLVDAQILERLEQLLARVEASQRKLVELLEQLKAGDESVRPQIEQLRQRIREDLRKVSQARSALQKELGTEFMNLDAFRAMEKRMERMDLEARLERGDVDGALESAREGLEELNSLRDGLQKKLGQEGEQSRLSEEERNRMQLLRELSRLLDEQKDVVTRARRHEEAWRREVGSQAAKDPATAGARAKRLREQLDEINDARLGREGRRGWEDAREALEQLESVAARDDARQLELLDAAKKAAEALERASAGAKSNEKEGQALERIRKDAGKLAERLRGQLPGESDVFDQARMGQLDQLGERQGGIDDRAGKLRGEEIAEALPEAGRSALDGARREMDRAGQALEGRRPDEAAQRARGAADGIQRAIDSLRQNQSPPPPQAANGESSTEAERDRTLRDELVEAMKERAPEGFDEQVESYYEELLR